MRYILVFMLLLFPSIGLSSEFVPTPKRTVSIIGPIGRGSLPLADQILKLADGSGGDIDLIIQSPGGRITVGRTIIQSMRIARSRGHVIRCAVGSMAASMAFSILANCSERYALREALMLYHPPRIMGLSDVITPTVAAKLRSELHKASNEIIAELLVFYPVPRKTFLKHYYRESWLTAVDLNADVGEVWITPVDDIVGLASLSPDGPSPFGDVSLGQIIYQYFPQ